MAGCHKSRGKYIVTEGKETVKKICTLLLVLLILASSSVALAECAHSIVYTKPRYSVWYHLNKEESAEYATTHYRSVYLRTYCQLCGIMLDEDFDYLEWADHTLPCGLCNAK